MDMVAFKLKQVRYQILKDVGVICIRWQLSTKKTSVEINDTAFLPIPYFHILAAH
jgi:hypothetical protein